MGSNKNCTQSWQGKQLQHGAFGKKACVVIASVTLVSACTVGPDAKPGDPEYAPVWASAPLVPAAVNPGAIYQPNAGGSLYSDRRARRVGDIITITLDENTQSSKSATTEITKETEIEFDPSTLLGTTPSFKNLELNTDLEQSRDFSGEGSSNQSNSLQGSIAVTVADILPNGLLLVRGEKWLTLNQGDEYIRIRGFIRPEDIGPDNTVPSNRIADARITYSGKGDIAHSNDIGWLSRLFNSKYWPF